VKDVLDNTDYLDFMKGDLEVLQDVRIEAVKTIDKHFFAIKKLGAMAELAKIDDDESCRDALNLAGDIKTLYKQIEEDRKKAIEPSRNIVNMVNDVAKRYQNVLEIAENLLKMKFAAYQITQQTKAEEAQKQVKALSESLGLDIEIIAPNAPKTMSSEKASTSTREKLTFEILDPELVPDEYWVIDEKMIQSHIALGKRDIPGVKIMTEKTMIIRRK
jgi:hypothetical protein